MSNQNSGLWIDQDSAADWNLACQNQVLPWLKALAGESDAVAALRVHIEPPTQAQAKEAFQANLDLQGQVTCEWNDRKTVLKLSMPFHGIFLSNRPRLQRGTVSVWASWLGEAPGFRLVRRANDHRLSSGERRATTERERDKKLLWRIGLPGGRYLEGGLKSLTAEQRKKLRKGRYFGSSSHYPDWLSEHLALYGRKRKEAKTQVSWDTIQSSIQEHAANLTVTDEDDLNYRRLMTFPVWLQHRISQESLRVVICDSGIKDRVLSVLGGTEAGDLGLAELAWEVVLRKQVDIQNRVEWAIHDAKSDDGVDFFDPINPLDLVSRITRVHRVRISRSLVGMLGAAKRQNHPSFRGRLCPVESPESEQVGICLQLAAGALIDPEGRIHCSTGTPSGELGFGAGLIPFFAHNDGARNMMGAKNLRQAVPVMARQRPRVETGSGAVVQALAAPLVEIGLCPDANTEDGGFGLGRDLLVAYLPWYGMNVEDAIVIGGQVAEQGWLDLSFWQFPVVPRIPTGWAPRDLPDQVVLAWSENGLAKVGTKLVAGSPIASFAWEGKEECKPLIIYYEGRTPAILRRREFKRGTPWLEATFEYDLEMPIPIKPGDKLMGRHGNKGVVGAILPVSEMPRLPDLPTLPEHLRGRPIDVLLNPHGVISRMNLGQLLETHVGWLLHADRRPEELIRAGDPNLPLAAPFADLLHHQKIQGLLAETGLDRYGRIRLDLPGGGQTIGPVTVGFQHIVRLRHIPEQKSQARRGGQGALYAARTGQAVRGRKIGGGQRVGEMEVWALAAHQAHAVLDEILGVKSNIEVASAWSPGTDINPTVVSNGYRQILQDWLFAMMINLQIQDDSIRFRFADDKEVLERAGGRGKVVSGQGMQIAPTSRFGCLQGGKKPCAFQLLDEATIAFPRTAEGKQTKAPVLCFGDLLAHLNLKPAGPLQGSGNPFLLPLIDLDAGTHTNPLCLDFDSSGKQLKTLIRAGEDGRPVRWTKELDGLPLYAQLSAGDGRNWEPGELLAEFTKTREDKCLERKAGRRGKRTKDRWVTEMRVACPEHGTSPLKGRKPFGLGRRAQPGGLADPEIFGSGIDSEERNRWGYIELPVAVKYPLTTEANVSDELGSVPSFRFLPVLPINYRLPCYRDNELISDPLDRIYGSIIEACNRYETESSEGKKARLVLIIQDEVRRLFKRLAAELEDKTGLIRQDGLGRRVDRSARLVIIPNPALGWDQAGIPVAVLVEIMGDLVTRWLNDRSEEDRRQTPLPNFSRASWPKACEDLQLTRDGLTVLKAYLQAHPEFAVLLNRQPTLHRDGFQAFHPVPLPPEAGDVIQLCPLACKGYAADFDGDEMVVHLPLSKEAQREAATMLPSKVLFSLAADPLDDEEQAVGNVLVHFDQDFVLGTWWMSVDMPEGARSRFIELFPGPCCRSFLQSKTDVTKAHGERLLEHIAMGHPAEAALCIEAWMRAAFASCTEVGVSFGFYELREIAQSISGDVENCWKSTNSGNQCLSELAGNRLKSVLSQHFTPLTPAVHFAAMALSGARGESKQVRQIIAARGMLDPGTIGFDANIDRFIFRNSLVIGLDPEDAFFAAMNSRSSMCDKKLATAYAGGLTRSLVFALWPYSIIAEDCGSEEADRNPASCLEPNGFCRACYGPMPNGESVPIGFPVGLIAAQSIGERGTQLSMQSFHGSERKVNIHQVRAKLGIGLRSGSSSHFSSPAAAQGFVRSMKAIGAYAGLADRHFYVLWKILFRTPDHRLSSAIGQQDPLLCLAYRNPVEEVLCAARNQIPCHAASPFAKVLLKRFATPIPEK